jgi:hypothetical protein
LLNPLFSADSIATSALLAPAIQIQQLRGLAKC